MENIEELAESNEYKNYNSVNTALSIFGQCLEPYTLQKLGDVHNKIITKHGNLTLCTRQCSKTFGKTRLHRWCSTCSTWRKELESFLRYPRNPNNWWKTKSWNWPLHAVNIAEVFMPLKWNAAHIQLNDLSTATNIWSNCYEFPATILKAIGPIRKLRNDIVHHRITSQRITDGDKKKMFVDIFNTLYNYPDVNAAIRCDMMLYNQLFQMLRDLEQHGITTKQVKELADRIEKILMKQNNSQESKIKAIGVDVKQIKEKLNAFIRYTICFVNITVTVLFLAVVIYAFRGQVKNNTKTVQRYSYKYANEDCLSEEPHTSFKDKPINMYGYISKHSTLIGRQWHFERLEKHLKESALHHGVMIIDDMGYVKSALAANIICSSSNESSYSLRKSLAAYYICRFDSLITKRKHIFIRRLTSMFSHHIPGFAEVLSTTEKLCLEYYSPTQCEEDPGGCIKHCLIFPLERLHNQDKSSYIVVLGALDECEHHKNDGGIAFLLGSNLHLFPKWIKFIVTCRNVTYCTQLNTKLHVMQLNSNDQENQDDLKKFNSLTAYSRYETGASNFHLVSPSVNTPEGKFSSFDIFYEQEFKRVFKNKYTEPKAILEIICASVESMTVGELRDVLSNTVHIAPEDYESSLQRLSGFIQYINGRVHIWHASLKYWLLKTNTDFRIDITKGHHYNAMYLMNLIPTISKRVDIVQLVTHASLAKSFSTESLDLFDQLDIGNLTKRGNFKIDFPLHRLARHYNNFDAMQHLIKHFPDLELVDTFNVTPVFAAASHGNLETLKALIQANANTNFRTQSYGKIINLDSAVRISLETHHWNYGILDIAAQNGHLETVKYIVQTLDYSLNKTNGISLLPIHLSCKYGFTKIVKYLYTEHKWMLDSLCLYFASENGHVELVSYLIKMGIEDKCKQCESKLHFIPRGKSRIQGTVIDITYDDEFHKKYVLYDDWNQIACETALHAAVRLNHIDIVKVLTKNNISKQANLCFDRAGRTPLISALQYNRTEIVEAFWINNLVDTNMKCASFIHISDFTQLNLIERKELGSYFHCNECTVMHVVAYFDRMWFLELFAERDVSTIWDTTDNMGCYPAHVAACVGSTQTLRHLIDTHGHEINKYKCINSSTPIEVAASCSTFSSFTILLNSIEYKEKQLCKEMKQSIIFNALSRSMEGIPPIDSKVIQDSIVQILDAVLSPEWGLNLKDIFQQNILHIVFANGHFGVLKKLFSTSPEISKQLMVDRDSNSRTPLDLAIANFGDTESIVFNMHNVPFEKCMMPIEHTILIALDFVEENKLIPYVHMKQMVQNLIRKNYITIVSLFLESNDRFYGDNDFVYHTLVQDKSNIVSPFILMQWITYRQTSSHDNKMCINNCDAAISYCHLHIVAKKHGEVTGMLQKLTDSKIVTEIKETIMMDFKLNDNFPDMLSNCYDKEGFNVLERAIQGRSHSLVKYLLDIGVTSNKHVSNLIQLALIPSVPEGNDSFLYPQNAPEGCALLKVIRNYSYIKEVLGKSVISSSTEIQNIAHYFYIRYKTYSRDITILNEHIDMVLSTLIAKFHNSIQSHSFCSKKGKTFSLVHIAAMHGLTLTLSNISEYFGKSVLNCSNYHFITPVYLAKTFNQERAVQFFHNINLHSSDGNVDQITFYLNFYLMFLKRKFGERHLMCIFDYNKVMPMNMYKILKAFVCIRRTAKKFKNRNATDESSIAMMNIYCLFTQIEKYKPLFTFFNRPHDIFSERNTLRILRKKFRELVMNLKQHIFKEILIIQTSAGFIYPHEDKPQITRRKHFIEFSQRFRNLPSNNYLSQMINLPFFNNAYELFLEPMGNYLRFGLLNKLRMAILHGAWIDQADVVRRENKNLKTEL